jgi:uncharacterized repeat protein (TIGR02543 family)
MNSTKHALRLTRALPIVCLAAMIGATSPAPGATAALLGWNNLGMHCMDSDYSVFSILPPYNTIEAQLIVGGRLVRDGAGYSITYQAVADPDGSFNSTAMGKGNFYTYSAPLYGATLAPEMGLAGWAMPGTNNVPQGMRFEPSNQPAPGVLTPVNWFRAEGIPLSPFDDAHRKNPYPLMRLVAHDAASNVVATSAIVLPVSDELDCRACHGSGTQAAARPAAGWASDPNPEREFRLNILRLHDDRQFTLHPALYAAALAARGFNPAGLYTNVVGDGRPVLCAACHSSEALGLPSYGSIPPLTASVHSLHASVIDPLSNVTLDNAANRAACYRCHPGSTTRCLRGAMGSAVAADGSMQMQCQSCHGNMSTVGSTNRVGWFMEPNCQSCHTGSATHNNGQIRYTSAFTSGGVARVAVDQTFATTPNTPAPGLSLFRFSVGHGGLQCEACHGSTHAEFPSSHRNDNLRNLQLQGHAGVLAECTACHTTMPNTVTGGPHGLHPVGQAWVNQHHDLFEHGVNRAQCQACHGLDYRGTVLSRAQADRQLVGGSDNGTANVQLFRGAVVGCYNCHNGPNSESMNNTPPPTVGNVSASTAVGQSLTMTLPLTGAGSTLRIISQAAHGSVGLNGRVATYFPEPAFVGVDTFTFAAYDGSKNSGLGLAAITVGMPIDTTTPTVKITSPTANSTFSANSPSITLAGTSADRDVVVSVAWSNDRGGSGTAAGTTNWTAAGIPLQMGVNVITITARDAANYTGIDKLTVTYSVSGSITVIINGHGTVSPNLNGQNLQAGKSYTMQARPGAGYVFAGWTGSLSASTPAITFVAQSNTVLQASFIPNPLLQVNVKGTYRGLFYEAFEVSRHSSGAFVLTLTSAGAFSGSLQSAGARYSFSGQFDGTGKALVPIARRGMNPLAVELQLDLTNGTDRVWGTVSDGAWTAKLSGDRAVFDGRASVAPQAGLYTMVMPGQPGSDSEPGGDSYATLSVASAGRLLLGVSLADGTRASQSSSVSKTGAAPLYLELYRGQGFLIGWLAFTNLPADDLTGDLVWSKPSGASARYPNGFDLAKTALGSRYTRPAAGARVLNLTAGQFDLTGGGLSPGVTNLITLSANNRVTSLNSNKLTMAFTLSSGAFRGSASGLAAAKAVSFGGVVLQKRNVGAGYFLLGNQSGQFHLGP